ncbi:hypothetical protein E4U21_006574 [Claviceps maximensis]|nr:hypothetical protein E4U21_006574 [Claviceps maximensis]
MKYWFIQLLLLYVVSVAAAKDPPPPPPPTSTPPTSTPPTSTPSTPTPPTPATPAKPAKQPIVYVKSGPVVGVTTYLPGAPGPVNKFLGIPYAEKPVRFALSQLARPWFTPINATSFGKSCYQISKADDLGAPQDVSDDLNPHPEVSEDCLFINAFAPATPSTLHRGNLRPVVLFIHGGAWTLGNGDFDLSGFAAFEDIVAFTFNYRLNIFGFPNADDIPLQERNLGIFDQHLALRWVRENAAAFGGDPSKITIWGFSAGSAAVDLFMHNYALEEQPPFRGAIMSSGEWSFGMFSTFCRRANETSIWDKIAEAAGCRGSKVDCLRQLPAERLLNITIETGHLNFLPIIDNKAIPFNRATAWRRGDVTKVPLLGGTSAQEGRSLLNPRASLERFNSAYLRESLVTKKQLSAIYQYYRTLPNTTSNFELTTKIYTDLLLQCPMRRLTSLSASMRNPTWRYYFNISMTEFVPARSRYIGKFHGSDIMSLFLSTTYEGYSPQGVLFSPVKSAFLKYWRGVIGRFVRNPSGGPGWPAVGSSSAPFDLATLGDLFDQHSAGATPVNETSVDVNCGVLWDVFDEIERQFG